MSRSSRLPNYLRAERKRAGLSQQEVAYLLGGASGTKISRYERFVRVPTLETALALKVIYRVPMSQLFAGLYEEQERLVAIRARRLARRLERSREAGRKLAVLRAITEPSVSEDLRYEDFPRL